MLTIKDFKKDYGPTTIVAIKDLTLPKGIHWFRGKNGSGKTTLFRSLSGIIPSNGNVYLGDGTSLYKNPVPYRQRVNYSEAEPLFPGFLTPRELMRFVGHAKKAASSQQHDLFHKFGINDFENKPVATFSSGMIKKLSLSLAFLGRPEVVILDEPLITLDDVSRKTLVQLINDTIELNQTTFLISSHHELDDLSISYAGTYHVQDGTVALR